MKSERRSSRSFRDQRRTTNDQRQSTFDLRPSTFDFRQSAKERFIVALDVPNLTDATRLVKILAREVLWFKIGSQLFTSAGPEAVTMVHAHGGRVFLDLKFHDIPNTMAGAIASACRLGVSMLTLHIAAGPAALRAAVEARDNYRSSIVDGRSSMPEPWQPRVTDDPRSTIHDRQLEQVSNHESRITNHVPSGPLLIGVTQLTSHAPTPDTLPQVVQAAVLAKQCGLDGVVASAYEARAIKAACGSDFIVVTPAIRPLSAAPADQGRVATPADALRSGADFLVVGRPIRTAPDPRVAARELLAELEGVLRKD